MLNSNFVDEIRRFEDEIETVACRRTDVRQLLLSKFRYVNILLDIFLVITSIAAESKPQRQDELAVRTRADIDFVNLIVYSG